MTEDKNPLQFLVENSNDIIYTADLMGYFTYANLAAERITGWPQSKITGRHYLSLVRPDFHEKISAFYEKQYNDQIQNTYFEFPIIIRDGTTRWIGQNVQLLSVHGRITGFQAIARDITDFKKQEDLLRESEKKYRFITEKMTDIVWTQDLNLKTVYVSPSVEAVLGFTPEERVAQEVHEQLTPESMSRALEVMAKELALEQQEQADPERKLTIELEYYHKDGSTRWIENIISGIRDDKGVLIGLHGVSRDVTKRRKTEKALWESERKYRELVDFLPISLFEIDLSGKVTSANRAIFQTFGYEQKDFEEGLNGIQMIIPDDQERLGKNIQRLLAGGWKGPSEYTGIRKDGSTFPLLIYPGVIIRDGKPVGLRGAMIDLTERKTMEESLKENEALLSNYFENAPDGIYMSDLQGNFIYGNRRSEEIIGYSREELIGKNYLELNLLAANSVNQAVRLLRANMEGQPTGPDELELVNKKGRHVPVEISTSVFEREGKKTALGFVRDITDRKSAERELQKAREQLLQSERLASVGRLSTGVAHEILNPVNIISMELQMLMMTEKLSPKMMKELKICMDQVSRIATITENLKQFSRVSEKKTIAADINDVVANVLDLYATQFKIDGIETKAQYEPDLPSIYMDREKIEQVIMNLITNAMAAMEDKEKKVLTIRTQRGKASGKKGQLKIIITDTGTGIKTEDMPKIFDPFFTTKEQGKGTGLGLSISYGIIHDHGGKIWAENNEEEGASFHFTLPVKRNTGKTITGIKG